MNRFGGALIVVLCSACAGTTMSERGRSVAELGPDPIPADCQRVKDLWASEGCGWLKSNENCELGARNQLRNEAADAGATHLRSMPVSKGVADYQATGVAYRCASSSTK